MDTPRQTLADHAGQADNACSATASKNSRCRPISSTFRSLLADVRGVTARELLAATDLPIGDIGAALAYANHGAFVRAFRQWTGVSPSAWRQATMTPSR
ncbi:helix-turn-helix domain-containing protein [Kaistia soli]|uniref:helix-turn-helix domain-containing protein n=1 Tax=Kaistia soli TaxID=446684 RepID=UPI000A0251F7